MKLLNQISLFIAFLIVFFLTSCTKDGGEVTPNALRKLDKVTSPSGSILESYSYDATGRCTRGHVNGSTSIYAYNVNAITETISQSWSSTYAYTYTLNAQGLATVQTELPSNGSTYIYSYHKEYNANGYLIREIEKRKPVTGGTLENVSERTFVYDTDEDLLYEKFTKYSGTYSYRNDYEYDKKRYTTIGNGFTGREFLGKTSPHFLTKKTWNGLQIVENHTATFNEKGYIISNTEVSNSPTSVSTRISNYTYK
jgi:hypothetical protein